MPLPRTSLDDRTYAQLRAEALAALGAESGWTDLNPTDPGLTVLELVAWIAECLIYRTGRITPADQLAFLRLLRGPDWAWAPDPDASVEARADALAEQIVLARRLLARSEAAVTGADYEAFARSVSGVHTARCVPRRHLQAGPDIDRPGHVTVVIEPDADPAAGRPDAVRDMCERVATELAPRRLIGTRVHVMPPVDVGVAVDVVVQARRDVYKTAVRKCVTTALEDLLTAWPLGEPLHVSVVRRVLEDLPGVDLVSTVTLGSTDGFTRLEHHPSGEPVGILVRPFERLRVDRRDGDVPQIDVHVARSRVDVRVTVRQVAAARGTGAGDVCRAVVSAVRQWFPPGERDLDLENRSWTPERNRRVGELKDAVGGLIEVDRAASDQLEVTVTTTPDRQVDRGRGIWFAADEFAHVRCEVEVSPS
jgi:hypothetical protein